jgi:3-hydroxyisobutyrate dehydrogenase-like beta-hydroxyacid dehydrogenase
MVDGVGFIGLGKMGGPMATRLIAKCNRLTVFDTRKELAQSLVEKGAVIADSAAAVASNSEVVFVSLPSPAIVREVALGTKGVAGGKTVKIFVDLSTTGPRVATEIAAGLAAKGIEMIDSPVSGGVAGAVSGTLAVMVAGSQLGVERCRHLLATIGRVFYVGTKPGLGQTMKLCNNLLSATALAISSEAMVMGVKAGLDPEVMLEIINLGSGRNSATQDKFPKSILPRSFDFGFTTGLMYKDVRLCLEEAEHLGVPMWVAPAVRQLWLQACSELGPESDFTEIVKCIERLANVQVTGNGSRDRDP